MLENKKDSRQIPKTKDICSNKNYYDVMYAYFQCLSDKDDNGIRYFDKKEVKFTKLGELFGISRQTASTRFKNLQELGLIKEYDTKHYELVTLEKDMASLIQYKTLKIITDTLSENSISTYIYLLNRYYANGCKSFQFTLEQVKAQIGIATTTRSNDNIVTNILFILEKIGLIKYELTSVKQTDDNFQNIKTIYQLTWLTNEIK